MFGENARRLLKDVLKSRGVRRDILVLYNIYLNCGCDPNIKRKRLMEGGVA